MMLKASKMASLLCLGVLLASAAGAQAPVGGEFKVNSTTGGIGQSEKYPAVAADAQGRFVVVWHQKRGGINPDRIMGRRFDAAGVAQGPDFELNTGTLALGGKAPRVGYEANGGFVVVWPAAGTPPGSANIVGRRYDPAGLPRGPEFLVATTGTQILNPRVSAGTGGGFVVAWREDNALRARPYDAAGTGMATVTITSGGGSGSGSPAVTMTPDGGFVAAWSPNAVPQTVWARLYDSAGVPSGPAFAAYTGASFMTDVGIASDDGGNFSVSWHEWGSPDDRGPLVRKFAADGTPLTAAMAVSTFTPGIQGSPDASVAPSGEIVVTWASTPTNLNCPPPPIPCPPPPPQDGSGSGVFGRRLDVAGNPVGGEFAVNAYTTGDQHSPTVAADATGRFIVAWEDWQRNGIYARRFSGVVPAALDVDRVATPDSNGNRVFEAGETVDIEPAWRNTTSVPLTFSGATASLAGPPGPTYTMADAAASYGTLPAGASVSCRDQADCYSASITGARPAPHWDAVLSEDFLPTGFGVSKSWAVHVGESFADMPLSNPFYRFVETILHKNVTGGCTATAYCPASSTTRGQMAVFVLVSKEPAGYTPPACGATPMFPDVPVTSPFCRWVEELARRGVVSGCGGGNYCPSSPANREQMAVFVLRTLDPALNPPACGTPVFADVPASSPFCRWIEELVLRGVVSGCGGGNYCPAMPVTRQQMAVFLSASFGLVLYGP